MDSENKKPENPQAFPQEWTMNGTTDNWENGMTLRDYFANGVDIPWNVVFNMLEEKHGISKVTFKMVAETRAELKYLEADAMLKQRELVKLLFRS